MKSLLICSQESARRPKLTGASSSPFLRYFATVTVILIFTLATVALRRPTSNIEGGTIILGLSTQSGVVVCADRKVSGRGSFLPSEVSTDKKISPLPGGILFAAAGAQLLEFRNWAGPISSFSYHPHDRVVEFFKTHPRSANPEFWLELVRYVYEPIRVPLDQHLDDYWPFIAPAVSGDVFLDWNFVVPGPRGIEIWWATLTFEQRKPDFSYGILNPDYVRKSKPFGLGWGNELLAHVADARDIRFADIRANPLVKRIILEGHDARASVSIGEARVMLQELIRAGSVHMPEALASIESTCAVVSASGFRWMSR